MDRTVAQARARGVDVIDLSKGNPDGFPEARIRAESKAAVDRPENARYTPFDGKPLFLQAADAWYAHEHSVALDPGTQLFAVEGAVDGLGAAFAVLLDPGTQLFAVEGAVDGLGAAFAVLLDPGDVVAFVDPYYPSYHCMARMLGAEELPLHARAELGWLPDLDAVPGETWDRVKLLVLNYPNNPTGAQAPPRFFARAVELAARHGFAIVHDFAYAGLGVHENQKSLLAVPGARDVGLEIEELPLHARAELGWLPDLDAVPGETWDRVKLLVLNYPNNPTGAQAPPRFFARAVELAARHGFAIVHDFAYAGLGVHENQKSLLAVPGARDVGLEIVSLSKMYAMAGWRAGFVAGNEQLVAAVKQYHYQMGLHGHVVRAGRRRRRARRGSGLRA